MMCMTELHGGLCDRTSTPHKSGNKMKDKKKIIASHYCIAILHRIIASHYCIALLHRIIASHYCIALLYRIAVITGTEFGTSEYF